MAFSLVAGNFYDSNSCAQTVLLIYGCISVTPVWWVSSEGLAHKL